MNIILSSLIIFTSLAIAGCICYRNVRDKVVLNVKEKSAMLIFISEALLSICDVIAGGDIVYRLPLDLTLCIIGLSAITSSIWNILWIRRISYSVIAVILALSIYYVLVASGVFIMMPAHWIKMAVIAASAVLVILQCVSIWWRIRDVQAVMKAGTVWQNLSLSVDCSYTMLVSFYLMTYLLLDGMFSCTGWCDYMISVMLAVMTFAFGIRVLNDSLFVLCSRHERTIIESMKISHVEVSNDTMDKDDPYREIYDRITAYFDKSMPYLNSGLTIADIGRGVFSNKLYISKAISQYTGRNFCQFVNYHRVAYSVNLFRKNPDLNVTELANASGFNNVASFSTAFKLFMNENPSDWCRRERVLLIKGKNKLWNP